MHMCSSSGCSRLVQTINTGILKTCNIHTATCVCCECVLESDNCESHMCVACEEYVSHFYYQRQLHTTRILDLVKDSMICNHLRIHFLTYAQAILESSPCTSHKWNLLVREAHCHLSKFQQRYLKNLLHLGNDDLVCIKYILKNAKPCKGITKVTL